MRRLLLLLSMTLASVLTFAQGKYEEVIYLKNGSIIHGMIVEYVPNASIKIKSGPNLFAYKMDEIEKITREELTGARGGFQVKTKGYYGIARVGLTDFPAGGNLPMASIDFINGYKFNRFFAMGAGVGADISKVNVYNVPIYLDLRADFLKSRVTPFASIGVGYNMQIQRQDVYNGWYSTNTETKLYHGAVFNPAVGVKGYVNKKVALSLSLGYKMIAAKVSYDSYYSGTVNQMVISHGLNLMAGIHF